MTSKVILQTFPIHEHLLDALEDHYLFDPCGDFIELMDETVRIYKEAYQ